MLTDEMVCPACGGRDVSCTPRPVHLHRCNSCFFDGTADRDAEVRNAGFVGYGACSCPTPFRCSEAGDCQFGYDGGGAGE
jgi:hypothetical protein